VTPPKRPRPSSKSGQAALVRLMVDGTWDEALALLDAQPIRMQRSRGFGLIRAAVLQGKGIRRAREEHVLDLANRFPQDAEVALEVAEYWLDVRENARAATWIKRAGAALQRHRPRNPVEVAITLVELQAELLVRRGRTPAAKRLVAGELQKRPDSDRLASLLARLWNKQSAR